MMHSIRSILLSAVLLLTIAPAGAEPQLLTPIPDAPQAPDFTLEDLDGVTHKLSDYRGKVVLLNFWATWCPPCRREMPSMERAWLQVKNQDVVLLAVNVGEDLDTVYTFLADYPLSFPLLLDEEAKVVRDYPVRGLPTSYVIDPEGRLVYQAVGGREWDDPKLLDQLLELRQGTRTAQPAGADPVPLATAR